MTAREIELTGGAPWGFRMHGGVDQNQPLKISRRYSDSIERICEVNPGRKASLSGIREGDVISSINGRPTKNMSNAEAHAMLRGAGPVLRLGLNEDREISPRRRSFGRSGVELKRPSQLIAELQNGRATPQAPVYATIRPSQSPGRMSSSPNQMSILLSPGTVSTDSSIKPTEETVRFHPTNPFYSTLPSNNYSSASRLPIPNSRASYSSLDRCRSTSISSNYDSGYNEYLKSPSQLNESGPNSLQYEIYSNHTSKNISGRGVNSSNFEFGDIYSNDQRKYENQDPYEKYLLPNHVYNEKSSNKPKANNNNPLTNGEEITRSTVTEHEIKEYEEVKTVKRIILNGSAEESERPPLLVNNSSHKEPTAPEAQFSKPPLKSPSTPVLTSSPTSKPVWRPGAPPTPPPAPAQPQQSPGGGSAPPAPPLPIWSPSSANASPVAPRKTFKPVHFEDSAQNHRHRQQDTPHQNGLPASSEDEDRPLRTSLSAPASGLSGLTSPGSNSSLSSRLPRAQNPTVTLLQKAREGQLPRGACYISERDSARLPRDRITPPRNDPVHALRREYASEGEGERGDYERFGSTRRMANDQRKIEGIGPTTKEGMPVALRSEVKDQSRWYKKMYDTIHKNKYDGQPSIQKVSGNKSQYAYFDPRSGYLSEPEGGFSRPGTGTWSDAYDSDATSGPRRRTASVQDERRNDVIASPYLPSNKYSTLASARASQEVYKNQPGRIENYIPGRSSVVDKEAKQWWDEVMDIFDGQLSSTTSLPQASPKEKKEVTSAILSKSNMARALKESGYESDSTLVFRRRDGDIESPLSPAERRAAYRDLQAGGEPPLRGFRSPAPLRQESPRRYVESDVNIHYRCPVRRDPLPLVPERELARQQAEHMKRLYREQRRTKYLQELQDMQNRRHQDNFTPAQKSIVPLNRYDETDRTLARALYTFNGQSTRELSFKKGELVNIRRQVDNNWYEGELHGRVGLLPYNYVEILKGDVVQSLKKPSVIEGRARAKFDFIAQTNLELPLKKGELVVLARRIDHNWWEGRLGNRTGIFPDSYITVLQEPSHSKPESQPILATDKPVASPASHGLLNGSAKRSMGSHSYTPQLNSPALANAPPATQPLPGYLAKPAQATLTPSERGYGPPAGLDLNNSEPLYVDTNAEAVPYRAMYKYRPQNPDELELREGDTVYVLEKCDDGWYVGSSQRTGRLGTFPGNYVERI